MKTITIITGVLLVLSAVILAVTIVSEIMAGTAFPFRIVMTATNILIASLGAIYLLTGAKKYPGGKLLKAYFIINLISEFVLFIMFGMNQGVIPGVFYTLAFAGFSVLTVASDLGELKSKLIAGFIVAVELCHVISRMIAAPDFTVSGLGQITRLLITVSLLVLIWAKYKDKAVRGTK